MSGNSMRRTSLPPPAIRIEMSAGAEPATRNSTRTPSTESVKPRFGETEALRTTASSARTGVATTATTSRARARAARTSTVLDDAVDDLVLLRLLRAHEVVALGVLRDLVQRLPSVLGDDLVEPAPDVDDLLGMDLDVGRLAGETAGDLVDQDLRVRQRHALALGAAGEQQRTHRHRDADADGLHAGLDELHRVVDREARVDRAPRRVDVDGDVLVRVLGLEVDQLRDDQVRDVLGNRRAEEDDPLVEQTRVDVEGALAARRLLDHHGDKGTHWVRQHSDRPGPAERGRIR